ncbi:uncharacterized protein K02A2.6-like [Macrobrachium nipponense]|uniref:uncharacterized protein K02A2.6-like n=1 Tax=Macrobrachium nipponense TaxID=159736 RepID=UPI0030C7A710
MGHTAVACRQGKVPKSQHQVNVGLNQTVNVANESSSKPDVPELQRLNLSVTNNARLYPAGHNVNENEYHIFEVNDVLKLDAKTDFKLHTSSKYFVNMKLNNVDIDFELDTGAAVTCVGEYTVKKFYNSREEIQAIDIALTDYNKQPLEILDVAMVKWLLKAIMLHCWVEICLNEMKMDWPNIFNLKSTVHSIDNGSNEIANILKKYESVFETELGCLKDFEVSLKVKSDATPVYKHARSVPYNLREMAERELQRLQDIGVIKPVDFSEWASPTVNIVKSDGKNVRICADFKETLNTVCSIDSYPLPIPEDIFATLARVKSFTKLDLSHVYHQLKLSVESHKYMVINTNKGLFAFTRLQYGLNSAVGIFQRIIENVLKDIPNVAVYLDDIVITGPTEDDHLKTLELVLHKLCSGGLKLKKDKCSFMNKEVQYLGHKLDAEGEQESEDGSLKPVSYASRTLTRSEKNYSQTEKEGLSVIWAVNKFHKYLYGRKFEIWTDHKPLLGLLGEGKAVPHIASGRIIRWSLVLSGYDHKLKYKPGCKIPNADCLSRFPTEINEFEPPNVEEVLLLEHVNTTNVNSSDIRRWTDRDPVLSQVRSCIMNSWDDNFELNEDYKPFVSRKNEFTVLQGCILWGNRIIVPPQGRDKVTDELHDTHPGIVKMKNLARCYVWWPHIDKDLERKVNSCKMCQQYRHCAIDKQPLHPWEFPSKSWSRIHIDYAGPIESQMFLVVIDAYSKWLEVVPAQGCTSKVTVSKLSHMFCTHGLPDVIVSDNATAFVSEKF